MIRHATYRAPVQGSVRNNRVRGSCVVTGAAMTSLRAVEPLSLMQTMGTIRVVAVDIGSTGLPSIAWAAFEPPSRQAFLTGNDPQSAVSAVVAGLAWGAQAALLLESPQSVPVPAGRDESWQVPGTNRDGVGSRGWSAGAGRATGHAQVAWMLRQLAEAVPGLSATTQPDRWQPGGVPLLLAEAFVSSSDKPARLRGGQGAADAEAAGLALVELLNTSAPLSSCVSCSPQAPFNLFAAMALWAGLSIDPGELNMDVLVIAGLTDGSH